MQPVHILDYNRMECCAYKDEILRYLKKSEVCAVAAGPLRDVFTNKYVRGDYLEYRDDAYMWTTKLVYHFEKYDCVLPEEFVQHILKKLGIKD